MTPAEDTAGTDEWTLLVDTTRRLLARTDAPGLTIQVVLDESGLSTRSLYRHFHSKEDLVAAALSADVRRVESQLLEACATALDPLSAVRAWVDAWLDIALGPASFAQLRVAVHHLDPHVADAYAAAQQQLGHLSRALLAVACEQGRGQGIFPESEPQADAWAAHAVIADALTTLADGSGQVSSDDLRARMLSFLSRLTGAELSVDDGGPDT